MVQAESPFQRKPQPSVIDSIRPAMAAWGGLANRAIFASTALAAQVPTLCHTLYDSTQVAAAPHLKKAGKVLKNQVLKPSDHAVREAATAICKPAFKFAGKHFIDAYEADIDPKSQANLDQATALLAEDRKRYPLAVLRHKGHHDHPLLIKQIRNMFERLGVPSDKKIFIVASRTVWERNPLFWSISKAARLAWNVDFIYVVQDKEIKKDGHENDPKRTYTKAQADFVNAVAFAKLARAVKQGNFGALGMYPEGTRANAKTQEMTMVSEGQYTGFEKIVHRILKNCVIISMNPIFEPSGRNWPNVRSNKRVKVQPPILVENGKKPELVVDGEKHPVLEDIPLAIFVLALIAATSPRSEQGTYKEYVDKIKSVA